MRALRRPPEDRDAVEAQRAARLPDLSNPAVAERYREVQLLETERGLLDASIPRVVTAVSVEPAQTRILPRGNWMDESAPIVEPAIPRFLGALDTKGERATRLDLANWLVARDNPLTARTFVNRTWREFFGTGLSKVLDDLGSQGEWPTHPELLDWLAAEFMHPEFDAAVGARLGRQAHHPAHRHEPHLPAVVAAPQATARQRRGSGEPPARASESIPHRRRERARCRSCACRACSATRFGGPSVSPIEPAGYLAALNFPEARVLGEPRRGPVPARRCTRPGSARFCTRAC